MRSPIVAMLWENWRLSRVEAALRFAVGIVAASVAMGSDSGALAAFTTLVLTHGMFWFSIARLNGGRFLDGYKPGFPLYLLYTRPVPTSVFIGVAMAYDAFSCVALYVISAALLGLAFGQPLPLLSVASSMVAFHFACTCVQWSTRNRVAQWIGSFATGVPFFILLKNRVESPLQVEFSLFEYALMVLVCVVSFGLTVAGVARQRRGDSDERVPRTEGSGGYPAWLVTRFRFPCPTSSATRAQVWFELKSSGLPVLTIGLTVAVVIFLLFAISIPVAPVRNFAIGITLVFVPAVMFFLGGNAFGIRRRQGRTYASAFEATQPYGTARMAGLKVFVRTACVLAALIAVGLSAWVSSSLMGAWGEWVVEGNDGSQKLLQFRRTVGDAFEGLSGYTLAALAVVTTIAVAIMVASFATFMALRARYGRRLLIAVSLLLLYVFALALLTLAERGGFASALLLDAAFRVTFWIAGAAMVFTTIYLVWRGFAERALTIRYACGAFVITAAFGAAWLTVLHAAGEQFVVSMLWLMLLPLMAGFLAPWALNRIRHI